jgi:hypothetical protein
MGFFDTNVAEPIFITFDYFIFCSIVVFILFFWQRLRKYLTHLVWYSLRLFSAIFFALIVQGFMYFSPPYQFVRTTIVGFWTGGATSAGGDL